MKPNGFRLGQRNRKTYSEEMTFLHCIHDQRHHRHSHHDAVRGGRFSLDDPISKDTYFYLPDEKAGRLVKIHVPRIEGTRSKALDEGYDEDYPGRGFSGSGFHPADFPEY